MSNFYLIQGFRFLGACVLVVAGFLFLTLFFKSVAVLNISDEIIYFVKPAIIILTTIICFTSAMCLFVLLLWAEKK